MEMALAIGPKTLPLKSLSIQHFHRLQQKHLPVNPTFRKTLTHGMYIGKVG
jgi:ribosomal protein L21E